MNDKINVPIRESELSRVLSRLAFAAENCEKSLEEFKVHLSSVCNKEGGDSEKAVGPEYSTLLAQEINKIAYRLERLCEQMNYLRKRIEL